MITVLPKKKILYACVISLGCQFPFSYQLDLLAIKPSLVASYAIGVSSLYLSTSSGHTFSNCSLAVFTRMSLNTCTLTQRNLNVPPKGTTLSLLTPPVLPAIWTPDLAGSHRIVYLLIFDFVARYYDVSLY